MERSYVCMYVILREGRCEGCVGMRGRDDLMLSFAIANFSATCKYTQIFFSLLTTHLHSVPIRRIHILEQTQVDQPNSSAACRTHIFNLHALPYPQCHSFTSLPSLPAYSHPRPYQPTKWLHSYSTKRSNIQRRQTKIITVSHSTTNTLHLITTHPISPLTVFRPDNSP